MLPVALRRRAEARLGGWLGNLIGQVMVPLDRLEAACLPGAARGLVFQLREGLGSIARATAQPQIAALSADDRKALRARGVRVGLESVFVPALLKPRAIRLRALLWTASRRNPPATLPSPGFVTTPVDPATPDGFYEAIGYRVLGERAVRVDILDRIAQRLMRLARHGPFELPPDLASIMGLSVDQTQGVVAGLGYRQSPTGATFERAASRRQTPEGATSRRPGRGNRRGRGRRGVSDSPFARLAELRLPS
jgi:ATP-dependent RNA helicase SUPV3L1/SUV3